MYFIFICDHFNTERSIHQFIEQSKQGCNAACKLGRKCLKELDLEAIHGNMEKIWGKRDEPPKLPGDHRATGRHYILINLATGYMFCIILTALIVGNGIIESNPGSCSLRDKVG